MENNGEFHCTLACILFIMEKEEAAVHLQSIYINYFSKLGLTV
jgi:hypothetical protein